MRLFKKKSVIVNLYTLYIKKQNEFLAFTIFDVSLLIGVCFSTAMAYNISKVDLIYSEIFIYLYLCVMLLRAKSYSNFMFNIKNIKEEKINKLLETINSEDLLIMKKISKASGLGLIKEEQLNFLDIIMNKKNVFLNFEKEIEKFLKIDFIEIKNKYLKLEEKTTEDNKKVDYLEMC